jgi:uncharacterized protein YbjT (DUF2867 family)
MKYVLTGGAGNITRPLALQLLAANHEVTVIGRNASNLEALVAKGAKAAIGSIEDKAFLTDTFRGADAVYTMVPPHLGAADWKAYIGSIGAIYAEAIKAAGVKYVVNLSSIGADLPDGCGPVSGLHRAENQLNSLEAVNILHLRPGYFFANLLGNIGMVKHMQIIGSNFGTKTTDLVLSATDDIAQAAAEALLALNFIGHTVQYLASDIRPVNEIAKVLGAAIGQPQLPWVTFTDEQAKQGLLGAGLPEEVAANYAEMGAALESGRMSADFYRHRPATLGATKLEDFAKVFAAAYQHA